jgi:hypothetical protein
MSTIHPRLLIEYIEIMAAKRAMLLSSIDNIKTLVVGSSHGDFGFNPVYSPNSFNLCCRSQDLKHSFHLYEKITATCNNLKNLVVFYSSFSASSVLERSPTEKYICPAINEIFQLEIQYDDVELRDLCASIIGNHGKTNMVNDGINGFFPSTAKGFFPNDYGVKRKVSEHLRYSYGHEGDFYLLKMILLAEYMNHNVVIVVPPARSDYVNEALTQNPKLFNNLENLTNSYFINKKVSVLNLFNSKDFSDEEFGDFDHLLPVGSGVLKLTEKINATINNCQ